MPLPKLQRLICLLLLVAFTASGTSVCSATVMLMAELDGSHAILVNESQNGTCLTLRHRQGEFTPTVCDHASPLARIVVRLCQSDRQGDHNLTASHLTTTINEGKDLKCEVGNAPMLNDHETLILSTVKPWTPGDMNRLNPLRSANSPAKLVQHWALNSIQLLI